MAPPVRKLPEGYELAAGYHRGRRVTKHKAEKPFRPRPSRLSTVIKKKDKIVILLTLLKSFSAINMLNLSET